MWQWSLIYLDANSARQGCMYTWKANIWMGRGHSWQAFLKNNGHIYITIGQSGHARLHVYMEGKHISYMYIKDRYNREQLYMTMVTYTLGQSYWTRLHIQRKANIWMGRNGMASQEENS